MGMNFELRMWGAMIIMAIYSEPSLVGVFTWLIAALFYAYMALRDITNETK